MCHTYIKEQSFDKFNSPKPTGGGPNYLHKTAVYNIYKRHEQNTLSFLSQQINKIASAGNNPYGGRQLLSAHIIPNNASGYGTYFILTNTPCFQFK
jgi:hypothetical protein